ncbi:hypothetical protein [Anaerotruncus rubiinfantis]|uniref:hypothetical protein n=1 Tax=Anaerotruncus rubiinfantis TaxID=1720200 RepID=UPI001896E546|nr:hypothetical protein [Anaerotruncus rubiinfantis]
MDKREVEKLIEAADKRAKAAYDNYQDTGNGRYYRAYTKNEELADALRGYMDAKEKIYTANRLSAFVRGWAGTINEMQYYSPERKETEIKRILNEIMAEAIGVEHC